MVTVGLLVRLVAKPGKEAEVISFLEGVPGGGGTGNRLVRDPPWTLEFGIFDASDERRPLGPGGGDGPRPELAQPASTVDVAKLPG